MFQQCDGVCLLSEEPGFLSKSGEMDSSGAFGSGRQIDREDDMRGLCRGRDLESLQCTAPTCTDSPMSPFDLAGHQAAHIITKMAYWQTVSNTCERANIGFKSFRLLK
ncbi:hypothetical protein FQN60_001105 [Etheostoma spectabile]|uniref:Uncharacterized protein n=1 Tax=Etheostoma spectabile TaxID=54343 RepID=A0A5J5D8K0_9PERO|nr:hypothetical protein FQN60_001105 [Etheostoma spectabile]